MYQSNMGVFALFWRQFRCPHSELLHEDTMLPIQSQDRKHSLHIRVPYSEHPSLLISYTYIHSWKDYENHKNVCEMHPSSSHIKYLTSSIESQSSLSLMVLSELLQSYSELDLLSVPTPTLSSKEIYCLLCRQFCCLHISLMSSIKEIFKIRSTSGRTVPASFRDLWVQKPPQCGFLKVKKDNIQMEIASEVLTFKLLIIASEVLTFKSQKQAKSVVPP